VPPGRLAALAAICLVAGAIGAITGGNSLLTVPAMLLLGVEPRVAVGTNMLGVVFLSGGAAVRFLREPIIPRRPTVGLVLMAIPGSIVGALVASRTSAHALQLIISIAMVGMAVVMAAQPHLGVRAAQTSPARAGLGYVLMAVWAVYGGLFSGGYTTVLTLACVLLFGTSLLEAVGLSKVVNCVGSVAAVAVFAAARRIDWTIGAAISAAMLVGGWIGAHVAVRAGVTWLRRVTIAVIVALATKLLYDGLR
jgi:uncharacterized membrane protein YfcA